jgi:hypothetical protein
MSSCSSFVKNIDSQNDTNEMTKPVSYKLYQDQNCSKNDKIEFLGSDTFSQEKILKFLSTNTQAILSPIDIFAINSIFQMITNPHLASPSSRLQFIWYKNGEYFYHDYYSSHQNVYPYLIGIDDLLKKYSKRFNLISLLNFLTTELQTSFKVSKSLDLFLLENKNTIFLNQELRESFMRGDETLKEGEKIPTVTAKTIIELFKKSNITDYKSNTKLTQNQFSKKLNTYCNYNLDLYNSSIFLIHENEVKSNITGIRFHDEFILSSTSLQYNKIINLQGTIFFKGESHKNASAVCLIKNKNSEMGLISTSSRDPAQHIYRILDKLENVENFKEFSRLISHSRQLFLNNPNRIIYESNRDQEANLEEILKFQMPIYYADKLGEIWGAFKTTDETKLFFDNRTQGSLKCKN